MKGFIQKSKDGIALCINRFIKFSGNYSFSLREQKLIALINSFSLIIFTYLIVLGLSVLIDGNYIVGFSDLFLALVLIVNYSYFFKKRDIKLAAYIVVTVLSVLFIFLTISGGQNATGPIWSLTYPIVAFQLIDRKKAKYCCFFILACNVILLSVFKNQSWMFDYAAYCKDPDAVHIRVFLVYSVIYFIGNSAAKNRSILYDELEALNDKKTNFFLNLAHETKTPLTMVSNYLATYLKNNKTSNSLNIVKYNIDKLKNNMTNFLDLEKSDDNRLQYNHDEIIDLNNFLNEKIISFNEVVARKHINIERNITGANYIEIDHAALDRLCTNLFNYVISCTDSHGKIEIMVRQDVDNVILLITDSSKGMSQDELENIFNPYYQQLTRLKYTCGIDMSLSIVKEIIEQVDGKIDVISKTGKGTAFMISFKKCSPLVSNLVRTTFNIEKPIVDYYTVDHEEQEYINEKSNVLIVEGNTLLIDYLKENLSNKFNFYYAENGRKALDKLDTIPLPDIIISDVIMDVMDGYTFYENISLNENFNFIPFIFFTGNLSEVQKVEYLAKGAVDVIAKPFSIDELIAKIDSIIKLQKMNEERIKQLLKDKISRSLREYNVNAPNYYLEEKVFKNSDVTEKEKRIIKLIKEGYENKEIAVRLDVSVSTIKYYLSKIYKKLNVSSRVELSNLFYG